MDCTFKPQCRTKYHPYKIKRGFNHLHHKRMFYWDEDGSVAGHGESNDAIGKLFSISENHFYPFYETTGAYGGTNTYMDPNTGMWVASGLSSCSKCGFRLITTRLPENTFDPNAMPGLAFAGGCKLWCE